jgi:ABC-type transporter Mla MlaB component
MTDTATPRALCLPAELTIYTAGETHAAWLAWLAAEAVDAAHARADAGCPVDGAAVDQVDAAGVQLLVSLANTLAGQQRAMHLVNASRPLRAACGALGADSLLADDDGADGDCA